MKKKQFTTSSALGWLDKSQCRYFQKTHYKVFHYWICCETQACHYHHSILVAKYLDIRKGLVIETQKNLQKIITERYPWWLMPLTTKFLFQDIINIVEDILRLFPLIKDISVNYYSRACNKRTGRILKIAHVYSDCLWPVPPGPNNIFSFLWLKKKTLYTLKESGKSNLNQSFIKMFSNFI